MFHVKHFIIGTRNRILYYPPPMMTTAQKMNDPIRNVSRETEQLLERYVALLQKWNRAINLIGKSTEREIWDRHIADSLQLMPLIPKTVKTAADFGSGAGLPGMVLAIARPEIHFSLVEQDQRKAAFLQEVVGQLGLTNVRVLATDINRTDETFDLITARALAPLSELCALAYPRLARGAICLFPKGRNFANEIETARERWNGNFQIIHSTTQKDASVISISELSTPGNAEHP